MENVSGCVFFISGERCEKTQTSLVSLLQFIINVLKVLRTVGLRRDNPLALAVNKSARPLPRFFFFFFFNDARSTDFEEKMEGL